MQRLLDNQAPVQVVSSYAAFAGCSTTKLVDACLDAEVSINSATETIGVCNLCEAICGLKLTIEGGQVTGIRGNPDDPLSRGHICPKGVALADIHNDPDRLRVPLKRVNGALVETTWDDALDLAADTLARTINEHGRDALGIYLGNPNVHSLGSMTHGIGLVKMLRTKNTYSATSVDQLPQQLIAHLMFGHQMLIPIPDIDRTDHFLVIGANPMASNGSLMTAPDFPNRMRALKSRGGRLVVVDPRRTETAKIADAHHFVRPGSDAFVLLAMLNVLFADDLVSAPNWVRGVEAVRLAVAEFTPSYAEERSGLPAETIRSLTHDLAAAQSAAVYGRVGVSTQAFGAVAHWAINLLNLLTGNLDREGGVMFTSPAIDNVGKGLVGRGHFNLWRSRVSGLPEFAGELPVSALREEIETPGEGQIKTLLTIAGNPVLSTPAGHLLGKAIAGLGNYVAIDIYLNETTRHASVVLPPTTALERDHYDLVFHTLAVRNTARFTPAALPKPDGSMHDWEIYAELARRTTARLTTKPPLAKRLRSAARLRLSPTALITALLLAHRSGVTMRTLRANPSGVDLGPLQSLMPDRLQTRDRLVDAAPDVVLKDLARLREAPVPDPQALLLIGRRHKQDCNSWMHNTPRLTRGKARHYLQMNPVDLASRGIADGAMVEVSSAVGTVNVEVLATDDVMPGVACLPHGFGHAETGQRHAATVPGVSINDLTDPELVDVSGVAALSGVEVKVRAAE